MEKKISKDDSNIKNKRPLENNNEKLNKTQRLEKKDNEPHNKTPTKKSKNIL